LSSPVVDADEVTFLELAMDHHESKLEEALAFYAVHKIEPFRVVDMVFYYEEDNEDKPLVCINFHMIDGNIEKVFAPLSKELVPYLGVACGDRVGSYAGKHLSELLKKRTAERAAFLQTHQIPLAQMENMAADFHRLLLEECWLAKEYGVAKRWRRRHRERWDPYNERIRQSDPFPWQTPVIVPAVQVSTEGDTPM